MEEMLEGLQRRNDSMSALRGLSAGGLLPRVTLRHRNAVFGDCVSGDFSVIG